MKDSWPKAAQVLASGGSASEAAAAAGVSLRTVQRWRSDEPEFVEAVDEGRAQMLAEAAGLLAAETMRAVTKLGEIIESGEERHALTASRVVLAMASRYRLDQVLEQRIRDLETAAGIRQPGS
jgi:hypothetical protein